MVTRVREREETRGDPPMIWYDGHSIPWGSDDYGA